MATQRQKKYVERITVNGVTISILEQLSDQLGDFKICDGGIALTRRDIEPHRARWAVWAFWWDDQLGRHEKKLTLEESRSMYWCRICQQYLGCKTCIDSSLLCEIECKNCHQYANEIGFWHHGNRSVST